MACEVMAMFVQCMNCLRMSRRRVVYDTMVFLEDIVLSFAHIAVDDDAYN